MDNLQLTPCIFVVDTSAYMTRVYGKERSLEDCAKSILRDYISFEAEESAHGASPNRQSALITYGGGITGTEFTSPSLWPPLPAAEGKALLGSGILAAIDLIKKRRQIGYIGTIWVFLISSGHTDGEFSPALRQLKVLCESFLPSDQLPGPPAVTLCVISKAPEAGLTHLFSPLTKFYPIYGEGEHRLPGFFQLFEVEDEYSPASWQHLQETMAHPERPTEEENVDALR